MKIKYKYCLKFNKILGIILISLAIGMLIGCLIPISYGIIILLIFSVLGVLLINSKKKFKHYKN